MAEDFEQQYRDAETTPQRVAVLNAQRASFLERVKQPAPVDEPTYLGMPIQVADWMPKDQIKLVGPHGPVTMTSIGTQSVKPEASLEREQAKYSNLIPEFLRAMDEIGQYGFDKYGDDSFQAKQLKGDLTRNHSRIEEGVIPVHAISHLVSYTNGVPHDHFNTLRHQLAAAAFNAMMEFYFANLKDEQPTEKE